MPEMTQTGTIQNVSPGYEINSSSKLLMRDVDTADDDTRSVYY